jgi:anhydro-N-acetylmuramic acid kinase
MTELAIGLMSGTSLDGVSAALVRIHGSSAIELLRFRTDPYSPEDRDIIRHGIHDGSARDLALLNVLLGERLAASARALMTDTGLRRADIAFIASHGQTIWHEPKRATLQLGDPAVIAEQVGIKVISDFRSRDMAAGGEGAPLVPIADALVFGRTDGPRALLNLGGVANVSWVPKLGHVAGVVAFDTGPGVSVIDAIARLTDPGSRFDQDGARAAKGKPAAVVVEEILAHPYFSAMPPKSTGRELFGDALAARILEQVPVPENALATAVSLTTRSIADQFVKWLPQRGGNEVLISGGGARNATLVGQLKQALPTWTVRQFSEVFFDGDAKEAVAFALLGWLTTENRPGNVPSATGAKGPRVLGRITPA